MVNISTLPRSKEPYLGWYLETKAEFRESYTCVAWEDKGDRGFSVYARALSGKDTKEERFEESRRLSLSAAKGKIFLGTWQHGSKYEVGPPIQRHVPTPLIRQLMLRGLHRLYERGFAEGDFQIDLDGVAFEIGVKRGLVDRAVGFLFENGYIEHYGTMGRDLKSGDIWLTHRGAEVVESQGLAIESFLQDVYQSTLGRLFSIRPELAEALEKLREEAASPSTSRQELVGFSSMVRDFVQSLTDVLYQQLGTDEVLPREKTIDKVRAITAASKSETRRDHVRALAEVVVTHWRRLNKVQQKAVHDGTIETQRLFTYVLLFVADLLDVVDET